MMRVLFITILILLRMLSSVKASSDDSSGETVDGFLNKAAHSLVYKSMAVILLSHLDTDEEEKSLEISYQHPIGDQIGKILKTICFVLIVACAVTFAVISIVVCCGLCCCRSNTSTGVRGNSYTALRHSPDGEVRSRNTFSEACDRTGKYFVVGLMFGLPIGVIAGTVAGINAWTHLL